MNVITIESSAFKELTEKIEKIAKFVAKSESVKPQDEERWLDSFEVAKMLRISTRTLLRLRKENLISYVKNKGRCLYKISEINRALNERVIKVDAKTLEDFHANHLFLGSGNIDNIKGK